jgi:membrane protease YdiL (CAAX protease family)
MTTHCTWRHRLVAATPVAVPVSMWMVFTVLGRRTSPQRAYNTGFGIYWAGWCFGLPLTVLGPRRAVALLRIGRGPTPAEGALAAFTVAGAIGTALVPRRSRVDASVGAVMIGSAVVNAIGEELLWRGMFLEEFGDSVALGAVWPWLGFTAWHLAPQVILPSAQGRWRFTLAAALVGATSTTTAWRGKGLRGTLLPHLLTDACGVAAAEFRLGRPCASRPR